MTEEKQVTDDELEEKSNKVKFAKPDSMAFRSHYAQQRRKKRKAVNAILVEPVYNPLINYKWTTQTPSDYVTDGVELVTNGGFDTDDISHIIFSSSATGSVINGKLNIVGNGIQWGKASNPFSTEIGSMYIVSPYAYETTVGSMSCRCGSTTTGTDYKPSQAVDGKMFTFVATSTTAYFTFTLADSNGEGSVDNISVQKVIQEPNKRYFIDSGAAPKYPALMASGSGVKFNGTGQAIPIGKTELATNKTFLFSSTKTTHNSVYIGSSNIYTSIGYIDGKYFLRLNGVYFYSSPTIEAGYFALTIDTVLKEVNMYINGVNIGVLDITGSETVGISLDTIGARNNNTLFYDDVISNVLDINQAITPTQIQYQYNNPEKFLYREDNVLKSEILTQSEIDNVVAFLPMNEVGDTVYDLAQEPPVGYPISNYTNSCRDEAINLVYGRQNALLKRDSLGVEYASSFNAMECDGVSYVDTGWIPPSDSDWIIECKIYLDSTDDSIYWFGSETTYIGKHSNNYAYGRVLGTNITTTNYIDGINHIAIMYTYATSEASFYMNGNEISTQVITPSTQLNTFLLGKRASSPDIYDKPIELFKVHTDTTKALEDYLAQFQGV